ncbi:hypothetical protein HY025_01125 [Candidatus Daviesbacteria bacterium]|nr:hypothetical protein [Candidatus Daviesbacteria bacterium]
MSTAKLFYELLLSFYPRPYRNEYGGEMKLLFEDLYQEELEKKKDISLGFWIHLILDVIKSTLDQHFELLNKLGLVKYVKSVLGANGFIFLVSLILLLPFITLMSLDTSVFLLTGSRELMKPFYNSPFWGVLVLTVVLILPLITVLLNFLVVFQSVSKKHQHILTVSFISQNIFNLASLMLGLFAIFMLFGHDLFPCIVHQTFQKGLLNFIPNLNYCRINS